MNDWFIQGINIYKKGLRYFTIHGPTIHDSMMHDLCINCLSWHAINRLMGGHKLNFLEKVKDFTG